MIFRSNNPLSPSVEITIDGVAVDYLSMQQVKLELSENKHDLARIFMAGIPPQAITDYEGAAVSISWHQGAAGHEFRGYVNHIDPEFQNSSGTVNGSPFQLAHIYCVGATFDMHAKRSRLWETKTLYDVVKAFADRYRYSFSIPIDTFLFPRLVQNEESDWAFLVRVCDALGFVVTGHGTHLHVFDRYKAIGRGISLHLLTMPMSNATMAVKPGQILNMQGSFGRVTPTADTNNEVITSLDNRGVVTVTNSVVHDSHSGRPITPKFTDELSRNAISPAHANRMIQARARHKFPYEATIEITGAAGIKPGGMVDLKQTSARFDGLWYVPSVTHTLTLDKYFTELKVIKDSTNEDSFRVPPVAKVKDPPDSVLHENSWRALTHMEETYG
jgi:phage protein D